MTIAPNPYRGFCYPREVIQTARQQGQCIPELQGGTLNAVGYAGEGRVVGISRGYETCARVG